MATPFHVELLTPERVLFSGEADEVSMRTDGGEIAFLARHEDFIGAIDITVVRIHEVSSAEDTGAEVRVALHGGFAHFAQEEGITILAGVAELADEIDVERARRALEAAEERRNAEGPVALREGEEERTTTPAGAMLALLYPGSAEAAWRRAHTRLEAAGALATT
jgi:F-type H+-transporting ATPase subunit epsilon